MPDHCLLQHNQTESQWFNENLRGAVMTQKSDGDGSLPIGAQNPTGASPTGYEKTASGKCQECGASLGGHRLDCSHSYLHHKRGVPIPEPEQKDHRIETKNLRVRFIDIGFNPPVFLVDLHLDYQLAAYIPQVGDVVTPPRYKGYWQVKSRAIAFGDEPHITISIQECKP
jgi:hypothetical protein